MTKDLELADIDAAPTTTETLIGIALAILGGSIQSGAFILQKTAHNKVNKDNQNTEKDKQKSVLKIWYWYIGIMIYSIGGTLNAVSLTFAAQSIISPLQALNLAWIAILSYFILKEPISKKDMLAIIIMLCGIVLVVYFGPSGDSGADITVEDLREYFKGIPYIIMIIALSITSSIIFISVKYVETTNFTSQSSDKMTSSSYFVLFSYIWMAAFFSSNNQLFTKSTFSIIISSIKDIETLKINATDYLSYIIIVIFLICLFSMEYFKQKGLAYFGALLVVPIFMVCSIIFGVVIGMVFFEEYTDFTVASGLLFALGLFITVCGVLVLSFDIGKIWTQLYDKEIKVALIDYDKSENKYANAVVYGGPIAEVCQQYFYTRPGIVQNTTHIDGTRSEMEQMVSVNSDKWADK